MERAQNYQGRDLISREGAEILARELNDYWRQRGHTEVQFWIEPMRGRRVAGEAKHAPIWCVRSNLVRGLPPKGAAPREVRP